MGTDSDRAPLAVHEGRSRARVDDVLVIGGGVIGLASAHALLGAGRGVRLLDRGPLGSGASHGNSGLITPSHALPLSRPGMLRKTLGWMLRSDAPVLVRPRLDLDLLRFGLRFARSSRPGAMRASLRGRALLLDGSRALYSALVAEEGLDCEWEERGLLLVFATEEARAAEEASHTLLAEHGLVAESLDPQALLAREPALRDDLAGGTFFPQDAHLRPDWLVRELGRIVRARGGQVEERCEVRGFLLDQGRVVGVRTADGERRAHSVVIATGALAPRLARELGLRLPVVPGKGYSLTCPRPDPCPRLPMILDEAAMGVTPWPSGLRLGGTVELAGQDLTLRPERLEVLRAGARRFLRAMPPDEGVERWCGLRALTPDELPIIDRAPRHPNVFIATGHGRMGVSMAPATGKLVAELVTQAAPHVDPAPYSLARFRWNGAPS